MTLSEIKDALSGRKMTIAALADTLGVNATALRCIMSGNRPLTEQLKRHIMLAINAQKSATVTFSVSLPDGACSYHLHAPEKLADIERQQVMQAIAAKIARENEAGGQHQPG